jgi:hypothetical protein
MAIGDYILCCKCEVKLIYDGNRDQREWWEERFGKEPEIECPNCKPQRTWVGLTDEEIKEFDTWHDNREEEVGWCNPSEIVAYIEAKLKEKNT